MAESSPPGNPKKQRDKRSRAQNGQNMDSRQPSASAAAALDEDALVESFSAVKLGPNPESSRWAVSSSAAGGNKLIFKNSGGSGGAGKLANKTITSAAAAFDAAQEEDDIFAVGATNALHVVDPLADAAWMSGAAAVKADKKKKQYGKKANKGGSAATTSKYAAANGASASGATSNAEEANKSLDDSGLSNDDSNNTSSNSSSSNGGSFWTDASTSTPVAKRTVAQGRPTPNFMAQASLSPMMATSPKPPSPALKSKVDGTASNSPATKATKANGQPASSPSPLPTETKSATFATKATKSGKASKMAASGGPTSPKSPLPLPSSSSSSSLPDGTVQHPASTLACSLCGATDHAKARCPVLGITLSGEAGNGGVGGGGSGGKKGEKGNGKGSEGKGNANGNSGSNQVNESPKSISAAENVVAAPPLPAATTTNNVLVSKSIDELLRSPPQSKASSPAYSMATSPGPKQPQKTPSVVKSKQAHSSSDLGHSGAMSMQVSSPVPPKTLASQAEPMLSLSSPFSPSTLVPGSAQSGKKKNKASPLKSTHAAGAETKSAAAAAGAATPPPYRKPVCFVLAPSEGLYHDTGPDHQESTKRLHALTGGFGHAINHNLINISMGLEASSSGGGGGTGSSSSIGGEGGALRRARIAPLVQWVPCVGPSTHHLQRASTVSRSSGSGEYGIHAVDVTVSDADLLRVHDWDYLLYLRQQCAATERATVEFHQRQQQEQKSNPIAKKNAAPGGSQPPQATSSMLPPGSGSASLSVGSRGVVPPGYLDSDTRLSGGSWAAARAAAGAAIAAVNLVMDGFDRSVPTIPAVATTTGGGGGGGSGFGSGAGGGMNGKDGTVNTGAAATAGMAGAGTGAFVAGSEGRAGVRRAFVCGRPPGHHAGPRGCVASGRHFWRSPDMCSCGFCLFNNAAIAAAYARNKWGALGLKVAIVDFDIHHGNGTQECLENLVPRTALHPLPPSCPPQSYGCFKPWYDGATDSSHVFFASINLEDGAGFYPGDGAGDLPITGGPPPFSKSGGAAASSNTAPALSPKSPKSPSPKSPSPKSPKSPSSYPPGSACEAELQEVEAASVLRQHIVNVTLTPPAGNNVPAPGNVIARKRQPAKERAACCAKASQQFRDKIRNQLLPKLKAFQPDLLIVSAGFDGHRDDFYHYLGEADYAWLTQELIVNGSSHDNGHGSLRVVSLLEGGYSLAPLQPPDAAPEKRGRAATAAAAAGKKSATTSVAATATATQGAPAAAAAEGGAAAGVVEDILPSDGGLVRGVLSHVRALAETE